MALAVQSLADVTQDEYDTALSLIRDMLAEAYPDYQLTGGILDALLVKPGARLEAVNQLNIDRVRQASSLAAIDADGTLADDSDETVVDRLVSNYRIARIAAAAATGQVTVVISALTLTIVAADTVFEDTAGHTFTCDSSFVGQTSADSVVGDTDRLISAIGDGNYSFVIDVTADATGTGSNIARGTALTTDSSIVNLVKAYATADFTGGLAEETNTALITRMRSSWTSRTPSTRAGLEGLLRSQTGFDDIVAVSSIGYGDGEQQRNHSIFPVSLPGRVDTYVRTQGPWENKLLTKTATLVDKLGEGVEGVWQITLTRDNGPVYQLDKVTQTKDADNDEVSSYSIISQTRGYDISVGSTADLIFLPDITSAAEAAYSRFATLVFTFRDFDTDATDLVIGVDTHDYSVAFRSMPGIAELQLAVASRAARSLVGDTLVKAPIPCFVLAELSINHIIGTTAVDEEAVQDAVANAINATGFTGTLTASSLIAAAQAVLTAGSTVSAASMSGSIVKPDGTTTSLSSTSSTLTIATDNSNMVSSRTCCFFAQPSSITLSVYNVTGPET